MGLFDGLFGGGQQQQNGTNGAWAPQSGNAAQIFGGMMGANQGIPSMLQSSLLSGYNNAGAAGQNAQNAAQTQNAANQASSANIHQLQTQLDLNRNNNSAGFAKEALMRPLLASLIGAVGSSFGGGAGSGLTGFASTNSPQAASLPGLTGAAAGSGAAARPGFNQIVGSALGSNWLDPVNQANAQFGTNINPLAFMQSPVDALRSEQQTNAAFGKQQLSGTNPGVVNLKGFF